MQFMKNDNKYIGEIISSGGFGIESFTVAHRFVNTPHTYVRYATEHKNDRIIYIANGSMKIDMYNNKPFVANKGDAVYIPYNIAYKSEWLGDVRGEVYSINYVMTDLGGYQITMHPEVYMFKNCDNRMLEGLFLQCYNVFSEEKFAHLLKCKYLFLKLIYTIVSMETNNQKSKVSKAVEYINLNFLKDIDVKELASMCNLGECMFRRCFKQETGYSPLKYKNHLKIQHAYELLTKEAYSVAEVMELTGFYDASYFNKCFKQFTGKSPSECKSKR